MVCENCKKLKKEIKMLNKLVDLAQCCEWDLEQCYEDILNGTDEGRDFDWCPKPDKEFAKWFAKRFNIKK